MKHGMNLKVVLCRSQVHKKIPTPVTCLGQKLKFKNLPNSENPPNRNVQICNLWYKVVRKPFFFKYLQGKNLKD